MNENKNNQDYETPVQSTQSEESQSLEDTIRKIKPYIDKLWAKKKQFLIFNGVVAVLAIIVLLLFAKPYYTSTVSILPEYGNQSSVMSSLSGLASMAGINIGDINPNEIYQKIIFSEKVIKSVAYQKYLTEEYKDSVNLIDYFEIETTNEDKPKNWQEREKFHEVYKKLTSKLIKTDIDRITTVLSITVKMPEPGLSAEVVNTLVLSLNKYVTTERQSFARDQSDYLYHRINQVQDSLKYNEEKLKEFREKNRAINNSPQLLLEQSRLLRKVEIAQSVFIELTKQYELVKLEEVKDTPIVNVMEHADPPVEKAGPKRILILFFIMLTSLIISLVYFFFKDSLSYYLKLILK